MRNPVANDIRDNIIQVPFKRSLLSRLLGRLSAWNNRRAAIRELQAMPDALLRDLGIERYEIADAVNSTGLHARLHPTVASKAVVAPLQQAAA